MGFANINVQNFKNSFRSFGFFDISKFEFRKNLLTKILNSQLITDEVELTNEFRVAAREYSHPLLRKNNINKNSKNSAQRDINTPTTRVKSFKSNSFKGDE